jgi:hypothetical protein
MQTAMRVSLILIFAVIIGGGSTIAGNLGADEQTPALVKYSVDGNQALQVRFLKPATENMSRSNAIQHGTHLCSAHSHCGTGHLCCSGHCKAVATCG